MALNPDAELERIVRTEGWRVMRFDKLARRPKVVAVLSSLALVGGGPGRSGAIGLRDRRGRARQVLQATPRR